MWALPREKLIRIRVVCAHKSIQRMAHAHAHEHEHEPQIQNDGWKWKVIWSDAGEQQDEVEEDLRSFADAWALSQPEDGDDDVIRWIRAVRAEVLARFLSMNGSGRIVVVEGIDPQQGAEDDDDLLSVISIERYQN